MTKTLLTVVLSLSLSPGLFAQTPPAAPSPTSLLGPDDQLQIRVVDAPEISGPVRISPAGFISLSMAGSIKATGLSVEELESEITTKLKKYYKDPEVFVTRSEMRSQPVSVLGAVNSPGIRELKGQKTLAEILSMAGGLREEAGLNVKITRRMEWGKIPLPNAVTDSSEQFSIAEIPLRDITESANPASNILIMPNDVITVAKADTMMVYVIGDVLKSGAIVLGGHQPVTVLQALSLASGLAKTAKPKDARILRLNPASAKRDEVPVDLKELLAGKIDDVTMQPNDILFVPTGNGPMVITKVLETAVQVGMGAAILAVIP